MSNMSYCRFRNTLQDLKGCVDAIEEGNQLSKEEYRAMRELVKECRRVVEFADYDMLPTIEPVE